MHVSVQEQERWRRRMSVTVPAAVVREEEQRAARKLASRAKMKGFRKGRVPARVIESRFAGALRQEALDKLVQDAYRQALASEKLRPISEGEIEDVRYEPEQDLTFEVAFDVQPVVELGRLGGFVVERPTPEVEEEQVQAVLEQIRKQNGAWRPAPEGHPEDGDLVGVKILRLEQSDAEVREYDFVLGQGDAIPDIEAAIRTLEPGGEAEFTIAFPGDFEDESKRGASERVRIALGTRRTLELPALDDDLARQVGDFESLAELTAKVREDMEKEAQQRSDATVRSRLLDLLLEANPFEVPASMVDRYVNAFLGQPKDVPAERLEEARRQIRPEAERAVKRLLIIERVAEMQGLAASEADIDARVEEIAAANDTTPAKVYASMQKAGRLESLENELTERKVFEFLMQQSEIT
ncbi:MAG TPA: trigger factor [Longimicrobiales bacterium]|nr:trigger factor [Longimicrobiales bacterium]